MEHEQHEQHEQHCACGHERTHHLMGFGVCQDKECECKQFRNAFNLHIQTVIDAAGNSRVLFQFQEVKLQLTSDAAVQIGLNLLSAGYAARGEQALYTYCQQHALNLDEIIKLVRVGT